MAKNFHTDNKAFMLYKDWEDIFQALDSSEEIGELVMALFAYAKRGESPKLSGGAKIAFLMMRAAIERDGIAWEEMCAQRSECGKKGGRPKKSDESGNTDEKAEQTAASADNAEEKPQGINDTAEKPKAFSQTKRFLEKAKKADKDKDIDKENISLSTEEKPIDEIEKILVADHRWQTDVVKLTEKHRGPAQTAELLPFIHEFFGYLRSCGVRTKTVDDCRAHFVNKMNREYIKTFNKHKCKTFKQDFYENQRPIEAPADGTDAYDAPF